MRRSGASTSKLVSGSTVTADSFANRLDWRIKAGAWFTLSLALQGNSDEVPARQFSQPVLSDASNQRLSSETTLLIFRIGDEPGLPCTFFVETDRPRVGDPYPYWPQPELARPVGAQARSFGFRLGLGHGR